MTGFLKFILRNHVGSTPAYLVIVVFSICGFLLLGCDRRDTNYPESHTMPSERFYVKRLTVENTDLYRDLGLENIARFEVKAPPDAKVLIWLETYKHGKLIPELSWGQYRTPARGRTIQEMFRWTQFRPPMPSPPSSAKIKWSFGFAGSWDNHWIDNPLPISYRPSNPASPKTWELEFGKDYLIWYRIGSLSGSVYTAPLLKLMKNDAVMLIKCRIEPVDNNDGNVIGSIDDVPP